MLSRLAKVRTRPQEVSGVGCRQAVLVEVMPCRIGRTGVLTSLPSLDTALLPRYTLKLSSRSVS